MSHTKYHATVTGTLMFAEHPENYITEASIICTQFSGTEGRDIILTRELNGPIPQISNECLKLITSWLKKNFKLKGTVLTGSSPTPQKALRETIINVLPHRKYTISGAIKLTLYDDRLEVFSPGALPGLIDIKNLGDGTTYLRNPHLARIARRLHLVEKLGSGIKLIFNECKKMGLKKPQYVEDGDFVKVIFEFSPDIENKQTDEESILKLISMRHEISITDVITLLNVSRNTATRKLNNLLDENRVKRHGRGPAVRYTKND